MRVFVLFQTSITDQSEDENFFSKEIFAIYEKEGDAKSVQKALSPDKPSKWKPSYEIEEFDLIKGS